MAIEESLGPGGLPVEVIERLVAEAGTTDRKSVV